jgi:Na+/melibiose symporter-like transporter
MTAEAAGPDVGIGLGLSQGAIMTTFFALAMLFTTRYDLNRRRHADILGRLDRMREASDD